MPSLAPPINLCARDNPNDDGGKINLTWTLSSDDEELDGYRIYRKTETDTGFIELAFRGKGVNSYLDEEAQDGILYYYKITAIKGDEVAESELSNPVKSSPQWFDTSRINVVIFAGLFIF